MTRRRLIPLLLAACQCQRAPRDDPPRPTPSASVANPAPSASAVSPNASATAEQQLPRLLALTGELAQLHEQSKDCDALVESLRAFREAHGAELRQIPAATYGFAERDARAKAELARHFDSVMSVGVRCRDNAGFKQLQAELTQR